MATDGEGAGGGAGAVTLDAVRERYPGAETFRFGDNRALCDELLALVRAGRKTATCGALRDYFVRFDDAAPDPAGIAGALPLVGRRDIALDWDGEPALVTLTVEVSVRRFCDVDEGFALAEGEDATLAGWQAGHRRYFDRNGGWEPEMELVCERFRLVEDLAAPGGG